MKTVKSILISITGILSSRIMGFVRDLLIARSLGASIYADIFVIIIKIPNLFRLIFLEGTFTQIFLPIFIASKNKSIFLIHVSTIVISLTLMVVVLAQFYPTTLIKIIASGFSSETIHLTVPYMKISIFYLVTISLCMIISTLLTFKHKFFIISYSSVLWNLSLTVFIIIYHNNSKDIILYYLSIGIVLGGILQLIFHIYGLYKIDMQKLFINGIIRYKNKKIVDERSEFSKNIRPALIANISQYSIGFIITILGSYCAVGTLSQMYYSNRLFQLPLALFAISVTRVIFPKITKFIKNKMISDVDKYMINSISILFFILLSSSFFLSVYSYEITKIIFYRGEFTLDDVDKTSTLLKLYVISLTPVGISKILKQYLYANKSITANVKISLLSLILTIFIAVSFMYKYGANGLIFGQSLGMVLTMFIYFYYYGLKNSLNIIKNRKIYLAIALSVILLIIFISLKSIVNVYI